MLRPDVMGKNGLVTSAHPLATQSGLKVLQEGGNAFDAAITVSAVLGVVRSHLSGVGGDLFILLYSAREGKYLYLNSSGRSPLAANIDTITSLGYQHMPRRGVLTVTVPGCVAGWGELWQKYGSVSLARILQPAIQYAWEGYALGHHSIAALDNLRDLIRNDPGLKEIFLPLGKSLRAGELLKQPELAGVLEGIATHGCPWFYQGQPALQIADFMKQKGALLTEEDLTAHTSSWGQPLSTTYGNYCLYQTPPNSQGLATLLAFNILEGLDFSALGSESPQLIHYLIETKKIACQYREQYITDPEFVPVEYEELLDKQFATRLRKMINLDKAGNGRTSIPYFGQSECFIVIDREGNTVTGAQSLHTSLGAGFIVPGTGIILQNSGASFSLDPAHINRLEPQKRPFHTLTATMAVLNGKPILVVGASGSDSQFQVQLQLITKILNSGLNIQEAMECPRWVHGGTYPGDPALYLQMEGRFSLDEIGELESWGHNVRTIDDWAGQTGEAQAVSINPNNGVYQAGTDPRSEAFAAAF